VQPHDGEHEQEPQHRTRIGRPRPSGQGTDRRTAPPAYPGAMRPVAVYSALRLGLFIAALLVLRLVGVGGLPSLVLALVVSMLLSFVVLRRQRDAVTLALMDRHERRRTRPRRSFSDRIAEDAAAEDAVLDDRSRHDGEARP
jgi:hypothetical protein